MHFTDNLIGRQLNKLLVPSVPVPTVSKAIVNFVIPFVGSKSFSIRNKISFLLRQYYPQINFRVIFKPENELAACFRHKHRVPDVLRSGVVYHYKCGSCNASYIGQTKRHLAARIAEHQGIFVRTSKPLNKPPFSSIRDHSKQNKHDINPQNFSIFHTATHTGERLICESLLTHQLKPSLSLHGTSTPLLCF